MKTWLDHDFTVVIVNWEQFLGENTVNGDQSDAHMSTLSQSSKEVCKSSLLHNAVCSIYLFVVFVRIAQCRKVPQRKTKRRKKA